MSARLSPRTAGILLNAGAHITESHAPRRVGTRAAYRIHLADQLALKLQNDRSRPVRGASRDCAKTVGAVTSSARWFVSGTSWHVLHTGGAWQVGIEPAHEGDGSCRLTVCRECRSPAFAIGGELTDATLVRCDDCGASLGTWAEFRRELEPVGSSRGRRDETERQLAPQASGRSSM